MPQDAMVHGELQSDREQLVKRRVTWRAGYWARDVKSLCSVT